MNRWKDVKKTQSDYIPCVNKLTLEQLLVPFSFLFFYCILGFGVHVQNMQDSCIGTHMAVCIAAFLPFTHIWHFSPGYPSPAPCPAVPPLFPPIDPSV